MNVKLKKFFSLEFYYAVLREELTLQNVWSHFLIKVLAVFVISIQRFIVNRCTVSASALTFYSILSLIPISALVLGIARGFGVGKMLENQLQEQTFTNPEVADFIVQFANAALENVNGGIVTGVGIVFLIWSIVKVLANTEQIMNNIWGVKKGRSYKQKFTDYLSIMFIAPILIILVSGMNVFLTSNLQEIALEDGFLRYASEFIIKLMNLLPYLLVWLLFIFLYMFMPTVQVRFKDALWGGILAGTVFQIVQWFYLRFQLGVSSYNAIYGSLAAFPLLLMWLQLSWSIILWGTELTYIIKNRRFMFYNSIPENHWSEHVEKTILVLKYIAQEYTQSKGVPSIEAISNKFKISISELRLLLGELVDKKIFMEAEREDDQYYVPIVDLYHFTVADLIIALSNVNENSRGDWEKKYIAAIREQFSKEYFT